MTIFVGLGWGDEGKGSVVDLEAFYRRTPIEVVRFNGGAQACHNVVAGSVHHAFRQYGAGTLAGATTFLSEFVRVDLSELVKEMRVLKKKLGKSPQMIISGDALLVTMYHQMQSQKQFDGWRSTCGYGVGTAYRHAKAHPDETIRIRDLRDIDALESKLRWQQLRFDSHIGHDVLYDHYLDCVRELAENGTWFDYDANYVPSDNAIFEGAQGALLHVTKGLHFPHTTSSDTSCQNALSFGLNYVVGVMRIYSTRHGNGYFPTEANLPIEELHNKTNPTQGGFRTGFLDLDNIKYAIDVVNGGMVNALAVNHVDKFYKGMQARINGEYQSFDDESTMLNTIENFLKLPIEYIGRGADRSEHYRLD